MMLSATLLDMDTRHITRQIAGSIVRDELARQGIKQEKAAQRMGVARSTLSRVIEGAEPVRSETLRGVEGLLGLPRRFLDFVIDGDAARVAKLKEMDADLRRHTLDALEDAVQAGEEDSQDKHRRQG
jgi:transcriptional regulator with XRE-family HTH domain